MERLTVVYPKENHAVDFTPGKKYEVLSVEDGWYRVVNDWGMDYLYPPDFFEPGKYPDGEYLLVKNE